MKIWQGYLKYIYFHNLYSRPITILCACQLSNSIAIDGLPPGRRVHMVGVILMWGTLIDDLFNNTFIVP